MGSSRLILSAVMFSPNLGDGVIAECVSHAAGVPTAWLDLAGRTRFDGPGSHKRAHVLRALDALPPAVSHRLASQLVRNQIRTKLLPLIDREMPGSCGVLFGGGQIFADAHLNFPLKIAATHAQAQRLGLPVAILGVGVSKQWSSDASNLFGKVFAQPLAHISVRDFASRDNLARHLARAKKTVPDIHVFPDPGFLASRYFRPAPKASNTIGLGITHPAPLIAHGGSDYRLPLRTYVTRYAKLAAEIARGGMAVELFTNGAAEDESCLRSVFDAIPSSTRPMITVAKRCEAPRDFMALVSGFSAVVSHRMHANIVAHSYGIPCVGLSWDAKMAACFDLMGRKTALLDGRLTDPVAIAQKTVTESTIGITTDDRHQTLLNNAARGVETAIDAIGATRAPFRTAV